MYKCSSAAYHEERYGPASGAGMWFNLTITFAVVSVASTVTVNKILTLLLDQMEDKSLDPCQTGLSASFRRCRMQSCVNTGWMWILCHWRRECGVRWRSCMRHPGVRQVCCVWGVCGCANVGPQEGCSCTPGQPRCAWEMCTCELCGCYLCSITAEWANL